MKIKGAFAEASPLRFVVVGVVALVVALFASGASAMYAPDPGVFLQRDPGPGGAGSGGDGVGRYADGMNLHQYTVSNPLVWMDPLGLESQKACCGKTEYDPTTHCCENEKVVAKVTVYVVNRSGGKRTGWRDGHIDMAIPGAGLIGFFGTPNGGRLNGIGMGMNGFLNNTPQEWFGGPAARPNYAVGAGINVRLPDGRIMPIPGLLSTICEVQVCPADAAKMAAAAAAVDAAPGTFNLAGRNCSTVATQILGAGGIMKGGISGLDNPQNLLDQLQKNHGAKCYNGYTQWLPGQGVVITNAGAAPPAPAGGGCGCS